MKVLNSGDLKDGGSKFYSHCMIQICFDPGAENAYVTSIYSPKAWCDAAIEIRAALMDIGSGRKSSNTTRQRYSDLPNEAIGRQDVQSAGDASKHEGLWKNIRCTLELLTDSLFLSILQYSDTIMRCASNIISRHGGDLAARSMPDVLRGCTI